MNATIALLAGDGIGPEVVDATRRVLEAIADRFGHGLTFAHGLVGGAAIEATGSPLPADTLALCHGADAVLLGAVGGPRWDDPRSAVRPEQGLLTLRKALGLYANLRPVKFHAALADASPLKAEVARDTDFIVVRELTGGIYFGEKTRAADRATDLCVYTDAEVARVVRRACEIARTRRGHLTSVDKANVLETSRLWRQVTTRIVSDEFPDVTLRHLLVDACAMRLIRQPTDFDVIVTENMFGDILTDEASVIAGSIGVLPSASLGDSHDAVSGRCAGLYEPIHGSAPDIAGSGTANPVGTILSAAMLLRWSLGLETEARAIESAVNITMERGICTPDAGGRSSTCEVMQAILTGGLVAC